VDLVREISIKHGLKGFDGEVDDTLVQEFMAKIARMSRDQNLVLERIKRDNEDIIGTAQNDLNSLLNKKSSLQQKKEYAQSEIKNVDMKVRGLKRDLDGLNADAAKEVMAKDELNKKEKRLEEVKAQAQTADNDGSLHIQNTKLRDLEEDIERVTEELYRGTRNADSRAQLAILKQNIETRQKAFASLYVGNLI
jgi:DNA repair protein RAD50